MTRIDLEQALRRSSSCFVPVIRSRIVDGKTPTAALLDAAAPPIAMISWPECDGFASLFLRLDQPAEVRA